MELQQQQEVASQDYYDTFNLRQQMLHRTAAEDFIAGAPENIFVDNVLNTEGRLSKTENDEDQGPPIARERPIVEDDE